MKSINIMKAIIFIASLAAIAVIAIYINTFSENRLSSSPETWGQLGDYMGGLLNPILSLINICVFVILTLVIQRATDKNNEEALNSAKRVALMQMKHEELTHFKKEMDSCLASMKYGVFSEIEAQILLTTYNVLEYRMVFLFPELDQLTSNRRLQKYIVENLESTKSMGNATHGKIIGVSNTYGMLVSDLSKLVIT